MNGINRKLLTTIVGTICYCSLSYDVLQTKQRFQKGEVLVATGFRFHWDCIQVMWSMFWHCSMVTASSQVGEGWWERGGAGLSGWVDEHVSDSLRVEPSIDQHRTVCPRTAMGVSSTAVCSDHGRAQCVRTQPGPPRVANWRRRWDEGRRRRWWWRRQTTRGGWRPQRRLPKA